jgi:hypothetical protein
MWRLEFPHRDRIRFFGENCHQDGSTTASGWHPGQEAVPLRGPERGVEVTAGKMGQDPFRTTFGGANSELLTSTAIGFVSDQPTVGRPGRMVFICSGRVGKVFSLGCFGEAKQIPSHGEQDRLSVRGKRIIDAAHHVGHPREPCCCQSMSPQRLIVVLELDFHLAQRLGGQVDGEKVTTLLEGNGRRTERGPVHVVIGKIRKLPEKMSVQIITPDVLPEILAPVGDKIDLSAKPHRISVGSFPLRQAREGMRVEVIGVNILLLAAEITLP